MQGPYNRYAALSFAAVVTIAAGARAQTTTQPSPQRLAMAEQVIAREEATSERAFDPAFRERTKLLLAGLSTEQLAQVQAQEGGLGLNVLGDTQADLVYTPVVPCRIIDTRKAGGALSAGVPRSFKVTGDTSFQGGANCAIPFGPATSAVINFVAVGATAPGDLRVTPFGTAMPTASILNWAGGVSGLNLANGLSVALCNPGTTTCTNDITLQADGSAIQIVADVEGYYESVSSGGIGTALLADSAVTTTKIASGAVVKSLNGQTDAVTLAGANGLSAITGSGTVTVSSSATDANAAGAIVARDGSGNFLAGSVGLAGTLDLPNTSLTSVGTIRLGGTPFLHAFGSGNTFVGTGAGNFTLTGGQNSGFGSYALHSDTTGYWNTAVGFNALMPNTTGNYNSAYGGVALQSNTTGSYNSAFGLAALQGNTTGALNTAVGYQALYSNTNSNNSALGADALYANTSGSYNAAFGTSALQSNTTANNNSAFGYQALYANTTGPGNAAFGYKTLAANTTGYFNSAFGSAALYASTTGYDNSAFGFQALAANTTGYFNAAFGSAALTAGTTAWGNSAFGSATLTSNTTGHDNGAFGWDALYSNTTGNYNTALGSSALFSNTTGTDNSAVGSGALSNLASGSSNIAVGSSAGLSLVSGSNNIYIGHSGTSSESYAIHIGTAQSAAYIAGIYAVTSASGVAVYVNSSGQLGTATSSRRYKEQIADMAGESDVLMRLRPVSFYYRPELDTTHTRQYGLVAEEVAEIAPELVLNDEDGKPQTVRYHFVNAMLLNEVQKQRATIERQSAEIQALAERLAKLEADARQP